jgi:hypothetical protein
MRFVNLLAAALFLASSAAAVERWTKTYGGASDDRAWSGMQNPDGSYIAAGRTESFGAGDKDFWFLKLNTAGDTVWARTYGTAGDERGSTVQPTQDGGYILAGVSLSGTDGDIWVIKTDAVGDTQWTRRYAGGNDQMGYMAMPTWDGGYIISGSTHAFGAGSEDVYLIKTNSTGDTLWTRTYGGTDYEMGYAQPTPDNGYIIWGATASSGAGSTDVSILKTDSVGNTIWMKTYGGTDRDEGSQLRLTGDGGYIVAAYTWNRGAGQSDAWLMKLNASGDTLWTRTYGGTDYDEAYCLATTADGGYILSGQTRSFGAGDEDIWLIKTNGSGDTLWTRTFGGPNTEMAIGLEQTLDGGYVIVGYTKSFGAGDYDVYVIKTDANGSLAVEEPRAGRTAAARSLNVVPTPFSSCARVVGREAEQFGLYDISGKLVSTCRGDRVGEGLAPAVYFIKSGAGGGSQRIVKTR